MLGIVAGLILGMVGSWFAAHDEKERLKWLRTIEVIKLEWTKRTRPRRALQTSCMRASTTSPAQVGAIDAKLDPALHSDHEVPKWTPLWVLLYTLASVAVGFKLHALL